MSKILFITNRLFWPASDGHRAVLSAYCKSLHYEYGYSVNLFSFLDPDQSEDDVKNVPNFIDDVKLALPLSLVEVAANAASAVFGKKKNLPLQSCFFLSKANEKALLEFARELQPAAILVDMIRLAPYIEGLADLDCKKILYLEDVLSRRYSRQMASIDVGATRPEGVAGKLSSKFPPVVNSVIGSSWISQRILASETRRTASAERRYIDLYDHSVLVSPTEAKKLSNELRSRRIVAVPLGVEYAYLSDASASPAEKRDELSFVGDMRTAANRSSVQFIVDRVLPHLGSSIVLNVIGPFPDDLIDEYVDNHRVRFWGRVDDLRTVVKATAVFCAPISFGTGIKTKILEAMAMGVPVVTNSIGAEGIGLVDGVHALIRETPEEIADAITALLDDPRQASVLSRNAADKIASEFDWAVCTQKFKELGL